MAIGTFRRIQTKDSAINRIQDSIGRIFKNIAGKQILDGVLLKDISITTSETPVEHTLGRQPLGWIITDIQGSATVYRNDWDAKFLKLQGSASTTINIWVF